MDLYALECFLEVASLGNFTLAAEELFTTQSNISKQIKALEKELDFHLFDRSKRRIKLTPSGEVFYAKLPAIISQYKIAVLAAKKQAAPLRIGILPVMAHYGFAKKVSKFADDFPDCPIVFEESDNRSLTNKLSEKNYELIVVRDESPNEKSWKYLTLASDELVLVVNSSHPFANSKQASLKDFALEKFLLLSPETGLYNSSIQACMSAGFTPNIVYVGSSTKNIIEMLNNTNTVAIFMGQVANSIKTQPVKILKFAETVRSEIILAHTKNTPLSTSANNFWKYMSEV